MTTGAGADVQGQSEGILAIHRGQGDLAITAGGEVTSITRDGIDARILNATSTAALTVTGEAGSVISGDIYGIYNRHTGLGSISVTADGEVNGSIRDGIFTWASNTNSSGAAKINAEINSILVGKRHGVVGLNNELGAQTINVDGMVTGNTGDGIYGFITNPGNARGLTVSTGVGSEISGNRYGINARIAGLGLVSVTVDGKVSASAVDGVTARITNTANTGGIVVTTGVDSEIYGKQWGIFAGTVGYGPVEVTVNGDVSGGGSGIRARAAKAPVVVTVNGYVHNASNDFAASAIQAYDNVALLTNNGEITGRVNLWKKDDVFTNNGTWNTRGGSQFDSGTDELDNEAGGLICAGGRRDTADLTQFLEPRGPAQRRPAEHDRPGPQRWQQPVGPAGDAG